MKRFPMILSALILSAVALCPLASAAGGRPTEGTPSYQEIDLSQAASEKIDALVAECRGQGFASQYDQALWLHDWLIANADYDTSLSNNTPDGVLLYGTGVCQSYTEAYHLMLNGLGIENCIIASDSMDHAWNLARLDGTWCHIDCTWDDPVGGGFENHSYFGANDALLSRDHVWDRAEFPACDSLDNFYYLRMGVLCAEDAKGVLDGLNQEAAAGATTIEIYYVGSDPDFSFEGLFDEWFDANAQDLGLRSCAYSTSGYYMSVTVTYA